MDEPPRPDSPPVTTPQIGRRGLLGYLGAAGAGAVLGGGAVAVSPLGSKEAVTPAQRQITGQSYSPFGEHQTGITTPKPASFHAVAFNLRPNTDKIRLARLMRAWTADIEALMAGRPVPGDPAGELAQANVSLTVTVGLGPGVFAIPGLAPQKPTGLIDIPHQSHDRLAEEWTGGDLIVLISADDETSVSYAEDRLARDAAPFASVAWVQVGSWRGTDAAGDPVTGRNLFGQVDGSGNPAGDSLASTLWPAEPLDWFVGGTCLVVRRIEMKLDTWNALTRSGQDAATGRSLASGAPLGKQKESDGLDLSATDAAGKPVIPNDAHARRAHPDQNSGRTMLRRGWNYHHVATQGGSRVVSVGLIFLAFVADIAAQYVPVQASLDAEDALNEWTTAIGSAVFAIPPGWQAGDWIASRLLG